MVNRQHIYEVYYVLKSADCKCEKKDRQMSLKPLAYYVHLKVMEVFPPHRKQIIRKSYEFDIEK